MIMIHVNKSCLKLTCRFFNCFRTLVWNTCLMPAHDGSHGSLEDLRSSLYNPLISRGFSLPHLPVFKEQERARGGSAHLAHGHWNRMNGCMKGIRAIITRWIVSQVEVFWWSLYGCKAQRRMLWDCFPSFSCTRLCARARVCSNHLQQQI